MWKTPWTNVYGVARSVLAAGTLLNLLVHHADALFRPLGSTRLEDPSNLLIQYSFFSLFPDDRLELARWLAIGILLVVASGWRPRLTAIPHWWLSASFLMSSFVLEGGDQITANLTLLLLPVALLDPRPWHWVSLEEGSEPEGRQITAWVSGSALLVIRIQVAVVYLHAFVGKVVVPEWANGTATYYWFLHPMFGAPDWLRPLVIPFVTHPGTVMAITWGVLVLELALFTALVIDKRYWRYFLVMGLVFHFGIVLVHGLFHFFLAMAAALILYLRPPEHVFSVPAWQRVRAVAGEALTVTKVRLGVRRKVEFG